MARTCVIPHGQSNPSTCLFRLIRHRWRRCSKLCSVQKKHSVHSPSGRPTRKQPLTLIAAIYRTRVESGQIRSIDQKVSELSKARCFTKAKWTIHNFRSCNKQQTHAQRKIQKNHPHMYLLTRPRSPLATFNFPSLSESMGVASAFVKIQMKPNLCFFVLQGRLRTPI